MATQFPDLKGKSVFITGGGSGIGAELTRGFVAQGAQVSFIGRSDASGFCDTLERELGQRPHFFQGDIGDTSVLQAVIQATADRQGGLDVLVNNAANDARHTAEEVDEARWAELMGVNLKAYFFACQAAAARMTHGASIINFSSISYMMGNTGYPLYTTANSGINGMTRSLAREWGPRGIRVNTLTPGWIMTQKQRELWVTEEGLATHLERQCLPRALEPHELVDPTLFLASNASSAMTGQALVIDGGAVVTG